VPFHSNHTLPESPYKPLIPSSHTNPHPQQSKPVTASKDAPVDSGSDRMKQVDGVGPMLRQGGEVRMIVRDGGGENPKLSSDIETGSNHPNTRPSFLIRKPKPFRPGALESIIIQDHSRTNQTNQSGRNRTNQANPTKGDREAKGPKEYWFVRWSDSTQIIGSAIGSMFQSESRIGQVEWTGERCGMVQSEGRTGSQSLRK